MHSLKNIQGLIKINRFMSSNPKEFVNRNPRNLERMRIAQKPDGYHLENPGRKYWHKLIITISSRTVKAQVVHYMNGPIIEAKTSEWGIFSQMYSTKDTCAYKSLGKIIAQRCLESGITEVFCDIKPEKSGKIEKFIKEVVNGGIRLEELEPYKVPISSDGPRPEKPWEVTEK